MRPHRRQPTRLPCPWDSPGKNTGVGCHFLLQCMKVKSGSEVTQLCTTLRNPMDCSLPSSSAHEIFQARVLEWGAITFSGHKCALSFPTPRHLWSVGKKFSLDSCHSSMGNRYDNVLSRGLQHTSLSCPSPTSEACSNSCTSGW